MKKKNDPENIFLLESTLLESQWMKMVFISLGLHLLILGLFLNVFPKGGTGKKLEPAYYVDLVSLSAGGPIGDNSKIKEAVAAPSPPPLERNPNPFPCPNRFLKSPSRLKTDPRLWIRPWNN